MPHYPAEHGGAHKHQGAPPRKTTRSSCTASRLGVHFIAHYPSHHAACPKVLWRIIQHFNAEQQNTMSFYPAFQPGAAEHHVSLPSTTPRTTHYYMPQQQYTMPEPHHSMAHGPASAGGGGRFAPAGSAFGAQPFSGTVAFGCKHPHTTLGLRSLTAAWL